MQTFYALQSKAYTENLGLQHSVGFSLIRSHIFFYNNIQMVTNIANLILCWEPFLNSDMLPVRYGQQL